MNTDKPKKYYRGGVWREEDNERDDAHRRKPRTFLDFMRQQIAKMDDAETGVSAAPKSTDCAADDELH